ncbi:hypothetical protein PR048_010850 [Dryococelus australis]|uniref:Uncharacterized protein n=1 Tax=Dryococelus australis TaxID=614101 RepID=A0ABQ9I3U1_9NEOP|nr:hypothetical protein PR048_010850 [Dryococelus australis]
MRVIEASMEQRRNERAGETGDLRENRLREPGTPPTPTHLPLVTYPYSPTPTHLPLLTYPYSPNPTNSALQYTTRLPTRRTAFDYWRGRSHIFARRNRAGGFSQRSPVSSAPSFRRCSTLTLIGSQDLDVKSRPNLFPDSLSQMIQAINDLWKDVHNKKKNRKKKRTKMGRRQRRKVEEHQKREKEEEKQQEREEERQDLKRMKEERKELRVEYHSLVRREIKAWVSRRGTSMSWTMLRLEQNERDWAVMACVLNHHHIPRVYSEVTLAIGSEFIRNTLDDSAPIADFQGDKKRIPYRQMWGNTGATANEQTSEPIGEMKRLVEERSGRCSRVGMDLALALTRAMLAHRSGEGNGAVLSSELGVLDPLTSANTFPPRDDQWLLQTSSGSYQHMFNPRQCPYWQISYTKWSHMAGNWPSESRTQGKVLIMREPANEQMTALDASTELSCAHTQYESGPGNFLASHWPSPRYTRDRGGVVVRLLASHLINRVRFPVGSLPDFHMWESCRTMPLVGGFSRGSPISPVLSFRRCSTLHSPHLHRISRPRNGGLLESRSPKRTRRHRKEYSLVKAVHNKIVPPFLITGEAQSGSSPASCEGTLPPRWSHVKCRRKEKLTLSPSHNHQNILGEGYFSVREAEYSQKTLVPNAVSPPPPHSPSYTGSWEETPGQSFLVKAEAKPEHPVNLFAKGLGKGVACSED